jgi:hypothetical protein
VDDEAIILDLDAGEYYGLNAVATRVWQLLGRGDSMDSLLKILLEEFDVQEGQLSADLEALTSEMVAVGLLRETSRPASVERPIPTEASS